MIYIRLRLKKLLQKIDNSHLDALLINYWPNVSYISGFRNRESIAIVSPKGCYFVTDFRYTEEAQREVIPDFKIIRAEKGSQRQYYSALAGIMRSCRVKRLGFEKIRMSYDLHEALRRALSGIRLIPTSDIVENLRMRKDLREIGLLKKAANLTRKGMDFIPQHLQAGKTECEISRDLEYYFKSCGADKASFDIIVASGANSSMPHARASQKRLKPDDIVLIDAGARFNGYNSDLTRTFFLGRMTRKAQKLYKIVDEAQRLAISGIKPGAKISQIDRLARSKIEREGFGKYFGHGLGHGIGLEVHEKPRIARDEQGVLQKDMVFTVEPGIYIPGWGGVRIEDMILVTKDGHEVLTKNYEL